MDALAVAAFAAGEAGGALDRHVEDLAAQPVLEGYAVVEGEAEAFYRCLAVGEHRLLGEAGDPLGQLEGAVEVAARLDHLVDQPDAVRPPRPRPGGR